MSVAMVPMHTAKDRAVQVVLVNSGPATGPAAASAPAELDQRAESIMFGFKGVNVYAPASNARILNDVQGYVLKGGMLAVVGPSRSGKSVLLRTLAGREPELHVSGSVTMDGRVLPFGTGQHINMGLQGLGYVPPEDMLIGELTVRETLTVAAKLRLNESQAEIDQHVSNLIKGLGLEKVGDNVVGTALRRGLSGGEKRRTSVGVELAAKPAIICLDEPTSGLDATAAYSVIATIRDMCRASQGKISAIIALQQPNSRILELFDHLLLIGNGGSQFYFGRTPAAATHFQSLGFPIPPKTNPTDFYLHLLDKNVLELALSPYTSSGSHGALTPPAKAAVSAEIKQAAMEAALDSAVVASTSATSRSSTTGVVDSQEKEAAAGAHQYPEEIPDLVTRYRISESAKKDAELLTEAAELRKGEDPAEFEQMILQRQTGFWRQYGVLTARFFRMAARDLTLYWLQFALTTMYGFLVGAFFWQLPHRLDARASDVTNGFVWLVFLSTYIQVFKMYYLSSIKQRYHHEYANGSFQPLAWTLSEQTVTLLCSLLTFMPAVMLSYFMQGQPPAAAGYAFIMLFFTAMAGVALMDVVAQLFAGITTAVIVGQGLLVMWCVFAGGSFIRWEKVPDYWVWLSETSIYTWSTRGLLIEVFKHIDYTCPTASIVNATLPASMGACMYNGAAYPCDLNFDFANQVCRVSGPTVLRLLKGIKDTDAWFQFGILVIIWFSFRVLVHLLLVFPPARLWRLICSIVCCGRREETEHANAALLRHQAKIESLEARLDHMQEEHEKAKLRASLPLPAQPGHPADALVVPPHLASPLGPQSEFTVNVHIDRELVPASETKAVDIAAAPAPAAVSISIAGSAIASASSPASPSSAVLSWSNLSLHLKTNGKCLVDHIHGMARGGEVLSVMGPSGAGKTTFLNALSGRAPYASISGSVRYNGRAFQRADLDYVPQFDSLNPNFTVQETLLFTSKLKRTHIATGDAAAAAAASPNSVNPDAAHIAHIATLLSVLGLSTRRGDRVASLSLGERKRLAIGCGLIGGPRVLFLDEPTTSLDSNAALMVVDYIAKVARKTGVICIMTIHQPSAAIFARLDQLLLLSSTRTAGGQTAFFGPALQAQGYFARLGYECPRGLNPSDYFLDLVSQPPTLSAANSSTAGWKDLFETSTMLFGPSQVDEARKSLKEAAGDESLVPSSLSRFYTLNQKNLGYFAREIGVYPLRALELIVLALFIGTLFLRLPLKLDSSPELAGALFFNVWSVLFTTIAAVPVYVRDRATFDTEYLNGSYDIGTHCLALFTSSLPYHLLTATLYGTVLHFLVGFHDSAEAWIYTVLSVLVLLVFMETVALILVEFLQHAMLATTFSMILLGMLFLLPGFFIKADDMVKSVAWSSYIVPTKYALNGQLINIFRGQNYATGMPAPVNSLDGNAILDQFFHISSADNMWGLWGIVCAFVAAVRLMHYAVVRFHYRSFEQGSLAPF